MPCKRYTIATLMPDEIPTVVLELFDCTIRMWIYRSWGSIDVCRWSWAILGVTRYNTIGRVQDFFKGNLFMYFPRILHYEHEPARIRDFLEVKELKRKLFMFRIKAPHTPELNKETIYEVTLSLRTARPVAMINRCYQKPMY